MPVRLLNLLANAAELASAVAADPSPARLAELGNQADQLTGRLHGPEELRLLHALIARAVIADDHVLIEADRTALRVELRLPAVPLPTPSWPVKLPCTLRQRGPILRFRVEPDGQLTNPDPVLIRTVVQAHDWWRRWQTGQVRSIQELAQQDGVNEGRVRRILPLAFLAPDLVRQILEGRQPADLTTERLIRLKAFPADWEAQRRLFR